MATAQIWQRQAAEATEATTLTSGQNEATGCESDEDEADSVASDCDDEGDGREADAESDYEDGEEE